MSVIFGLLRQAGLPHLWFRQIFEEAAHVPATVLGLFGVWLFMGAAGVWLGGKWEMHVTELQAAEQAAQITLAKINERIEANSHELSCARADRAIAYKQREIVQSQRLLDRATDDAERRELVAQVQTLQREYALLETAYQRDCL